jgi:hypothetical protein
MYSSSLSLEMIHKQNHLLPGNICLILITYFQIICITFSGRRLNLQIEKNAILIQGQVGQNKTTQVI